MQLQPSELIVNKDGSIYHINLRPEEIADKIILVGDPGRVKIVSSFFDNIEVEKQNREFFTHTGTYKGERISVISTGIGTDNIDIVVNELDALANINLETREIKAEKKSLTFVRIGTSGALQGDVPVDSFLLSEQAMGFDGLLNFYQKRNEVCNLDFEEAFKKFVNWHPTLTSPYVVGASEKLVNHFMSDQFKAGTTISAPGFYGPQGRTLRLTPTDPELNDKIEQFNHKGQRITNYEMESSAIYGLSKLLGHEALTVCAIIANRVTKGYSKDYHPVIKKLIVTVLDKLVTLD